MGIGIRIENLRKVYDTPPPSAARGAGFSFISQRSGPKEKKDKKKKFEVVALDDISLEMRPGEVFGLLGPNGAGKSTTIGVLTTRTRPTSGRAFIGEFDVWKEQVKAKRLIGVVPQRPNLDFALTAREILLFHGAYFGQSSREREQRAQTLLEQFKLTDRADHMVRGFSGGMMQRISIARAMMHDPEVLFLDEPSAGLDPQTRLLLWEIVRDYNRLGKTIVLTTHDMGEADSLCQRLAIIDHGRIISQGTPQELKASIPGGYLLRLRFNRAPEELLAAMRSLPGVTEVRSADHVAADVYADRGGPLISGIVTAAQAAQAELHDVHIAEPSLETLFLHHTGRSLRD
jgi:ABC-2 type transport system ATP-binding protein